MKQRDRTKICLYLYVITALYRFVAPRMKCFVKTLKFVLHSLFEERSKQLKNIFFFLINNPLRAATKAQILINHLYLLISLSY
jgi:hypothetical protein